MSRSAAQPCLPEPLPGWAELPAPLRQAARALGLSEPPLAFRPAPSGGWVIVAADGRKFHWPPEQKP